MHTIDNVTYLDFPHQIHDVSHRETPLPAPSRGRSPGQRRADAARDADHEDELIELVALGDLVAANTLKSRYCDAMWAAAQMILNDEPEADRVVEAAFEEAFLAWPPERGELRRWLLRIVRRAARARMRQLWGRAA